MFTTRAQTGNVFLACKDIKELNDVFEHWKQHNNAAYYFKAAVTVNKKKSFFMKFRLFFHLPLY